MLSNLITRNFSVGDFVFHARGPEIVLTESAKDACGFRVSVALGDCSPNKAIESLNYAIRQMQSQEIATLEERVMSDIVDICNRLAENSNHYPIAEEKIRGKALFSELSAVHLFDQEFEISLKFAISMREFSSASFNLLLDHKYHYGALHLAGHIDF